ncbi:helix-turn-helix domain-containing protein [Streptomyces sp. NBC_00566]|uniref:helix-turn-helix domain-containing protein n=1 Tax=Streptomyces sp. NBC_00566 TaxID=2975778 RepID=UPI002E800F36|nr:helix-turn-helix domain-containing protein [Streptomyces sp. NBC_00566]WUB86975.1 helix-turn-helix domain-containing protein [Streptomyces sp. NBC_00566]
MDTQHPSAPSRARSRNAGHDHPNRGGLIHDNSRHTDRFTVIGNHLAQHADLSLLAIGLGTHIQSLPPGARIDIKSLAARFPEGVARIAAALRELEKHGYLRRERLRVPGGRIVTRTISCNQPPAARRHRPGHESADRERGSDRPMRTAPGDCAPGPRRKALSAVPSPSCSAPALLQAATDVLADLRRHDTRLLLSVADTAHLAPGVAAWLERDVSSTAVRRALTEGLPEGPLRRPAALLAHRLTALLPPPPPFIPPAPEPRVRHPLQNCDGCERGFRSPEPGRCRDCRAAPREGA